MYRADRQLEQRRRRLAQTDPLQAADLDELEREILAGHQLGLESVGRANEKSGVAALAEFAGDGERWDHVAAGAATGE
jgi:GAF domain-containing protein